MATTQDVIDMIQLGDTIQDVHAVCVPLTTSDFDPRIEAIESTALLIKNTRKLGWSEIHHANQIKYIAEMAQLLVSDPKEFREHPPLIVDTHCTTSPLILGEMAAETILENSKYGFPCAIGTMPLGGGNSPLTAAGNVIMATAEILGSWAAIKTLDPKITILGAVISGVMDMSTSQSAFFAPEVLLQDIAVHQLFKNLYDGVVNVDAAYIDAKVPGLQAVFEKTFKIMALGASSTVCFPIGTLDAASTFSPTQAMIDLEVNKAIWFPQIMDRTGWKNGAKETKKAEKLIVRADAQWRASLKEYQKPELDPKLTREIDRIVNCAKRDLLQN